MLDHFDEVLLEQHITSKYMSKDERNKCVHYIRNLFDVIDSKYVINDFSLKKYEILNIDFEKIDDEILFNGFVSSGEENRWITGKIFVKGLNTIVLSNIYRLNELVDEESNNYTTIDIFSENDGIIIRKSAYFDDKNFRNDIVVFDDVELLDYYRGLIGKKLIL